jgi:hypothetical protein
MANLAPSPTILDQVISGVLVTPRAMRLLGVERSGRTRPKDVGPHLDHFKVVGVHAKGILAEMVKGHPFRDRTNHHLIASPVGKQRRLAILVLDLTVAVTLG